VTTPAFAFLDEQHCEVAYGAGNCFQATDGNWYAKSALVVAIAPTNAPGLDLNPISLVQSALNDLTGPISTVEKWILKQLVKLGSLIGNDITKVYSYLGSRLGGVENTISQLAGQVNALADRAGKDLSGDVGKLSKDAEGWVADAEHYADSAVKAFERDVLDPALRDLRTAISDAEKVSKAALSTFERDVVKPIEHDASEALHDAKKAVSFIDHSALDAIHLIDECWDWLEHLALHPVKEIEAIPAGLKAALPSAWTEAAAAPATSEIDKVIDWLTKELPRV
jgi:hypothetical protein